MNTKMLLHVSILLQNWDWRLDSADHEVQPPAQSLEQATPGFALLFIDVFLLITLYMLSCLKLLLDSFFVCYLPQNNAQWRLSVAWERGLSSELSVLW